MSDLGQTSSLVVRRPSRHLLLLRDLVLDLGLLVELVEGVDYDGYGEGDDQDPTDGTSGSAQLSEPSPEEIRKIIFSLHRMFHLGVMSPYPTDVIVMIDQYKAAGIEMNSSGLASFSTTKVRPENMSIPE